MSTGLRIQGNQTLHTYLSSVAALGMTSVMGRATAKKRVGKQQPQTSTDSRAYALASLEITGEGNCETVGDSSQDLVRNHRRQLLAIAPAVGPVTSVRLPKL